MNRFYSVQIKVVVWQADVQIWKSSGKSRLFYRLPVRKDWLRFLSSAFKIDIVDSSQSGAVHGRFELYR